MRTLDEIERDEVKHPDIKHFFYDEVWDSYYSRYKKKTKPQVVVATALVGFILLLTILGSFTIIPTGYTGVRSTFGQISEETVPTGFNWKIPFVQSIERVNNKQQDITFEGQIWSETKDRTAIFYDGITVTYQINPEKSAWIYAHVSDYRNNLVGAPIVTSAIKTSSKTLSDTDATNRGIIEPLTMENLQTALNQKYGEDVVFINKIVIASTDFEDSYNIAIAEKQKAQLNYEQQKINNQKAIEEASAQAEVTRQQAQAEADANKIKAEANAEVKKINAQANADAMKIEADAQAEANKKISNSLSESVLNKMYYDKWDGKLPTVTSDGSMLIQTPTKEE